MSLPPILPTGSMSSDEYVNYMMGYCDEACDDLLDQMKDYVTQSTVDDWDDLWGRMMGDVESKVTTLEASIAKINSQIIMARNAISKM